MDKQEWLNRCAARFSGRGGLEHKEAIEAAKACLENLGGDLTESPEDSADEDMSCWSD